MVDMGAPSATGGAASGHVQIWVDGQPIGDFPNLWLRTTPELKLRSLWLSLFHHDATHSAAGELIDNVVLSTERIGCRASHTLPPPANLRLERR
jgi:hypothetical protein